MSAKTRLIAILTGTALAIAAGAFLYPATIPEVSPQDTGKPSEALSLVASDVSLLSEKQKQEGRETGYVAFSFDGMHYVVEGIPDEYLKGD